MRTLALVSILALSSQIAFPEEPLTDKNFLGIWKTLSIDDSKETNRAVLVFSDRLVDVTSLNQLNSLKNNLDSSTVRFVALAVNEDVVQSVLKYHEGSSIEQGRLTIRRLEDQHAEIRYTLRSQNGNRIISRYKVKRYEPGMVPPELQQFVKSIHKNTAANDHKLKR